MRTKDENEPGQRWGWEMHPRLSNRTLAVTICSRTLLFTAEALIVVARPRLALCAWTALRTCFEMIVRVKTEMESCV